MKTTTVEQNVQPVNSHPIFNSQPQFQQLQLQLSASDPHLLLKAAYSLANPKMVQQFQTTFPLQTPVTLYSSVESANFLPSQLKSFTPMPSAAVFQVQVLAFPGQLLVSNQRTLDSLPSHFDALAVTDMKFSYQEMILGSEQFLPIVFFVTKQEKSENRYCDLCQLCIQKSISRNEYFHYQGELTPEPEIAVVFCVNDNLYLCHNCDQLLHGFALQAHKRTSINDSVRLETCEKHNMEKEYYNIQQNVSLCERCCLTQGVKIDNINVVNVKRHAEMLALQENRKTELQSQITNLQDIIANMQQFNHQLQQNYENTELALVEVFKKLFLDLQREKSLAVQQNVGSVILLQQQIQQYQKYLQIISQTMNCNAFVNNIAALNQLQLGNLQQTQQLVGCFQSCLSQRESTLANKIIAPIDQLEKEMSKEFKLLANLRNYGVQMQIPSEKLFKKENYTEFCEESFDEKVSLAQSEFTYQDIINMNNNTASQEGAGQEEKKIALAGPADNRPKGIALMQQMLAEQKMPSSVVRMPLKQQTNRFQEIFNNIQTQKIDSLLQGVKIKPAESQASQESKSKVIQQSIQQLQEKNLLYSLQMGKSFAAMKKLCYGAINIEIVLSGADNKEFNIQMEDISKEYGMLNGQKISVFISKKFMIMGEIYIYADFSAAEIQQRQYNIDEFNVFGE